jgi:BolA protein
VSDVASRAPRIRAALEAAFPGAELELVDESHLHRGHAGAREGKGHYSITITSDMFAGKLPLARHRAVFAALGSLMETDIHALAIDARTPQERGR